MKKRTKKKLKLLRLEDEEITLPLLGHMGENVTCNLVAYQPSILLPRLREEGKVFFEFIKNEDVKNVESFLTSRKRFSINCQNYSGATGLTKAVSIGNLDMVHILLKQPNIIIGDSVLHAVDKADCRILTAMLNKLTEQGKDERASCYTESPDYSPDLNPIMLAAINQDYEIIRLLLNRGHFVEKPHPPSCYCKEKCWEHRLGESLRESMKRLTAYKALASPAYICQSSSDPILTAFELSREFEELSQVERELCKPYTLLCKQCKKFAVELVGEARTTYEVKLLLRRKEGSVGNLRRLEFPRLALAVELEQKDFVAHPNVQQVIGTAWSRDWNDWKTLTVFEKTLKAFPRVFLLPAMAVIYLCLPYSNYARSISSPINKFLSMMSSYVAFLILLFVQNYLDAEDHTRGPPHTGLEWLIVLYVIGLLWMEMKRSWIFGVRQYYKSKWSVYKTVMLFMYIVSFGLWIWAYYDVRQHGQLRLERRFWHAYDPSLVAEGVYAIASVLAFGHLFYALQIQFHVGPMEISISRMFKDIGTFLSIFTIVILSFAIGLHKLYQYYTNQMFVNRHGIKVTQQDQFESFPHTLYTLFWAVFSMAPIESVNIVLSPIGGNVTHPVLNSHDFTQAVGHFLFAMYHVIVVIILVNMLIAMMSNSFHSVANNADMEWKFARTRVWLSFFEKGGTLPPPFNLIPNPKVIVKIVRWMSFRVRGDPDARFSVNRFCFIEGDEDDELQENTDGDYQLMMARLVQRYLRTKEKEHAHKSPTIKDIAGLENEIHEARLGVHDRISSDIRSAPSTQASSQQ